MATELMYWILLPQFCKLHYARWRNSLLCWLEIRTV